MSDEYSLHNIMSNLATRVGQLEGTVKTFMDNWVRQDQLAHDGRRVLHDRLDLIGRQVDRIAVDVQSVQQDVAEMKKEIEEEITPTIEAVENRKHEKTGARGVWVMIGSGILMAISALTYVVDKAITFFSHKP